MPIIEITCFRLESKEINASPKPFLADTPYDKPTATLRFYLTHAIRALSKSSKHPFHLLQDVQDTLQIYYVGKWPNVQAYNEFYTSDDRAELVKALEGCKAVMQWKGLYDILQYHHWESSVLSSLFQKTKAPMDADLVGLTRHNVSNTAEFVQKLAHGIPYMEKYSGYKGAAGRKVESDSKHDLSASEGHATQELERDEIVLLSGWASKEQYDKFRDSDEYREFAQIRSVTTWFERVLAKPIRLE